MEHIQEGSDVMESFSVWEGYIVTYALTLIAAPVVIALVYLVFGKRPP